MNWTAANIESQTGRRVVITGGNSGIGFESALELARNGAEIVLPARTLEKAFDATRRIQAEVPHAKLHPARVDLSSLQSIHAFAKTCGEQFPGQSLDRC